ncbi:MAG: hypothetical protein KDA54_03920 [Phycisphaerales bacterium]|nr:hypothetical protein [Phycisphaerales bacterium]
MKTVRFIDSGDRTEMKLHLKAAKFDVVECDRFGLNADGVGVNVESDVSEFRFNLKKLFKNGSKGRGLGCLNSQMGDQPRSGLFKSYRALRQFTTCSLFGG